MKRILFTVLIANALIILSLGSCSKEDLSSGPVTVPGPGSVAPPVTPPFIIDLVANNWVNYENRIYVNTFRNIFSAANTSGRTVKVYLAENAKEILINPSPITFMGNQLVATNSQTDVSIIYRCNSEALPFESLKIKVVVE